MYLRFTPALAISVFLTSILALWITVDVANDDFRSTVLTNTVIAATAASWLYTASGRRREKAEREQAQEEGERMIRRIGGQ